jgi:uncharacterized protein YbaA (DUF1428 family)
MTDSEVINRAAEIVQEFGQLVTADIRMARGFVETIPNGKLLVRFAQRLRTASRYLVVSLIQYGAAMNADCSASAASNMAYADDQLQTIHHADPFDIMPNPYNTFPPWVTMAWGRIESYLTRLDETQRYYEPDSQSRYLEVEGDVE